MPTYQITIPGYRGNPDGPDDYPDEFESFEGTEEELLAYLLRKETEWQTDRALCQQRPSHVDPWGLPRPIWEKLGKPYAPCAEWCRGVVEVHPLNEAALTNLRYTARMNSSVYAARRIEAAELAVAADVAAAAAKEAIDEQATLKRLTEKWGPK